MALYFNRRYTQQDWDEYAEDTASGRQFRDVTFRVEAVPGFKDPLPGPLPARLFEEFRDKIRDTFFADERPTDVILEEGATPILFWKGTVATEGATT